MDCILLETQAARWKEQEHEQQRKNRKSQTPGLFLYGGRCVYVRLQ